MTTAPSEITNATGMGGDGLSELVSGLLVGAAAMKIATGTSSASIVRIACFGFDRAFMERSSFYSHLAAMTIIIIFLPTTIKVLCRAITAANVPAEPTTVIEIKQKTV